MRYALEDRGCKRLSSVPYPQDLINPMNIEHFAINVADIHGIVDWYTKNLGLTVVRSNANWPYEHFLADDNKHVVIEFYQREQQEVIDYGSMSVFTYHIAFATDDIEAEIERLVAAGGTNGGDIVTTPSGDRLGFVRCPWGITIQLAQRVNPLIDA